MYSDVIVVRNHPRFSKAVRQNVERQIWGEALLVAAVPTGCNSLVAQARYCNSFQLTHMSREDHAQSIESAMVAQRKDKKLLQRSQLPQLMFALCNQRKYLTR